MLGPFIIDFLSIPILFKEYGFVRQTLRNPKNNVFKSKYFLQMSAESCMDFKTM